MTDLTPETTPTRDEAVPTVWKLVPIEPTPEMYIKGGIARLCCKERTSM